MKIKSEIKNLKKNLNNKKHVNHFCKKKKGVKYQEHLIKDWLPF